jgi:hypothetical protein
MDYTTAARVKSLLGIGGADTSQDTLIAQLITSTSMRFDNEMRRHGQQSARTEVYPVKFTRRLVSLKGAPVPSAGALTVKISDSTDFTAAVTLSKNDDYIIENDAGIIRMITTGTPFTAGSAGRPIAPYYLQVTYTGGLATNTTQLITTYPDLAQACDLQVAYLHRRRLSAGGNFSVGQSSTQYTGDYDLLADVQKTLNKYMRISL